MPGLPIRLAILLALAFAARYFWWRVTDTMNPVAPWFFYLFLAPEIILFIEVLQFFATTSRRIRYDPPATAPGWSVDVCIPSYNEPISQLRKPSSGPSTCGTRTRRGCSMRATGSF